MKPEFDIKNVQICGVSFDDVVANHRFREKFDFPFALLCDTDKKLAIAYGAAPDSSAGSAKRITVVVGPDGKVKKAYGSVNPAEHAQQVLSDLQ